MRICIIVYTNDEQVYVGTCSKQSFEHNDQWNYGWNGTTWLWCMLPKVNR